MEDGEEGAWRVVSDLLMGRSARDELRDSPRQQRNVDATGWAQAETPWALTPRRRAGAQPQGPLAASSSMSAFLSLLILRSAQPSCCGPC